MTNTYFCPGPTPNAAEIAQMRWQHSVLEERDFKAPWTALHNAVSLAHEVGASGALKVESVSVGKPKKRRPTVRFHSDVQLLFQSDESNAFVSNFFPLDRFCQWHTIPWSLRPTRLLTVSGLHESCDDSPFALISNSEFPDTDSHVMMQLPAPHVQLRAELPGPVWLAHADVAPEVQATRPRGVHAQQFAFDEDVDVEDDPAPATPSSSSSSHTQQRVCIFHLDDPPVFGRIDWTDFHLMMHEAALLLQVDDAQLLGLTDIARPLRDVPSDVVPLIAQLVGDIYPGEPRVLALADIEIHANTHEPNFFTAPVVDRAVYAFPQAADRQSVFQTVDVATYCRNERHRCLLNHNERVIVTLGNPRFQLQPGDYLKIVLPPPEECDWDSQRLLRFYRQRDAAVDSPSSSSSMRSGYSPSLVPSEEIASPTWD